MREPITLSEAVERLLAIHYRGKKKGLPIHARMPLIGALQHGQIDWECDLWSEVYASETGATYDEAGKETDEPPKYGYPDDFWHAGLAHDATGWQYATFIVRDDVNTMTAPYKVAVWLGGNGGGIAKRFRQAKGIRVDWFDVERVLGPNRGWNMWRAEAKRPGPQNREASSYKDALIRLIATALRDPAAFDGPLFQLVHDAFDEAPDESDIRRLVRQIQRAITPEDPPPID